ncbi:phage tail protein [Pseudoalteromonas luteoviolacea]|uniref:phage tail protein n=1 Tax=Pseudoalteromonas luteoviolacea TaxID=43657 RepID=UPI00114D6F3A|nr:phage tail protein [Pseudoalteromonas luteoviolacea]TQF69537.1 phage tail protein [Pseudoalteromonas luteoviolacea]
MIRDVMLALGRYRFSVPTAAYSELKRITAYRWTTQERINRMPAMQYLGLGQEEITITGTIYPYFNGGLRQVDQMRAEAAQGLPQLLVDGFGFVWGEYVVERIEETRTDIRRAGIPEKIEFNLTLKYYGGDDEI